MDDEREVSCPQCFASTAVPRACSYQPSQALCIQIRRGGVGAIKNSIPVRLQPVCLFDRRWSPCAVICHRGPGTEDGHYIIMQADVGQSNGWLVKDDAVVRPASVDEVAAMSSTCSIILLSPCAAEGAPCRAPPGLPAEGAEVPSTLDATPPMILHLPLRPRVVPLTIRSLLLGRMNVPVLNVCLRLLLLI